MKKINNKKVEQVEKTIRKVLVRWEKMLDGDINVLWECMYIRGMCSKEDLNEHRNNKK